MNCTTSHAPAAAPAHRNPLAKLALLAGGMGLSLAALGDTAAVLPTVSVRDNQPQAALTDDIGQNTSLSRGDLEAGGKADMHSGLRNQSGLILTQAGQGTTSGISLRGASGGQGLITLDGVPLFGNFAGFFPLSHFPLDAFDLVDISRGPGGDRRGSRTLGGAIHMRSRRLNDGDAFLHLEGGSYGTVRTNLGGGLKNALGNFTVVAGRADIFDGISQAGPQNGGRERDDFQLTNGLLRWDKEFDRGSLDSSFYFVRSREQMDGPGLMPNRTVGWRDDRTGLTIGETWVAQSRGRYAVADNWDSTLQVGYTKDRESGTIGRVGSRRFSMDLTSQLWLGRWENAHRVALNTGPKDALRLVWGVDAQQQHADSALANVIATHTTVSPLLRAETEIGDWLANAEARFDHNDQYGDHTVFNLGGGWRFRPDMTLWTKGGIGYRPPAVNERLHPLFGNNNLKPERSAGGEAGWRWQAAEKTDISLSGYYQHYQNMITQQYNSATGATRAGNVAEARVLGAELQTRHAWSDDWSSGLTYTFMDARNLNTGGKVPIRPEHQGQFWNELRITQPITFRVELTFRDAYWLDLNNTVHNKPAPRLNAQVDYRVNPKLKLYVRGENLNSERNEELRGFGYPGAAVYAGFHAAL